MSSLHYLYYHHHLRHRGRRDHHHLHRRGRRNHLHQHRRLYHRRRSRHDHIHHHLYRRWCRLNNHRKMVSVFAVKQIAIPFFGGDNPIFRKKK